MSIGREQNQKWYNKNIACKSKTNAKFHNFRQYGRAF